jgi:hypothetical protein
LRFLIISKPEKIIKKTKANLEMNSHHLLIFCLILWSPSIHCDQQQEHFIAQTNTDQSADRPANGPVQLEIIGDTTHLFKDEDFEKKEALLLGHDHDTNSSLVRTTPGKKACTPVTTDSDRLDNSVRLVNGSELTKYMSNSDETECFLVLFYVPWCPFSARLAPFYNALPRAFLTMSVLAFDVSNSVGYNTKFGTSAVPMVILFQHKSVLAKMNYTGKSLPEYIEFVANLTSKTFFYFPGTRLSLRSEFYGFKSVDIFL